LPVALGQENGRMPASIQRFFGERWSELTKLMSEVAPDGLEVNRMWQEMVRPPQSKGVEAVESPDAGIARSDLFELSKHDSFSYAIGTDRNGAHAVHLYCGDQEIEINGDWVPFYEQLLKCKSFTGSEALAWQANGQAFAWEQIQDHIGVLLHTGVLRRVLPTSRAA
jgi:hypothetical protein